MSDNEFVINYLPDGSCKRIVVHNCEEGLPCKVLEISDVGRESGVQKVHLSVAARATLMELLER